MGKNTNFGPGFSLDEIPYWIGFAAGVVICGLTLRAMGEGRSLLMLIGCMVSGVVVGFVFEFVWRGIQKQPPQGPPPGPPPNDQRVTGGPS
jgi:hypothetical protein